jgi:hypothetical protein
MVSFDDVHEPAIAEYSHAGGRGGITHEMFPRPIHRFHIIAGKGSRQILGKGTILKRLNEGGSGYSGSASAYGINKDQVCGVLSGYHGIHVFRRP